MSQCNVVRIVMGMGMGKKNAHHMQYDSIGKKIQLRVMKVT